MKLTKNENLLAVALNPNNDQSIKILMFNFKFFNFNNSYATN